MCRLLLHSYVLTLWRETGVRSYMSTRSNTMQSRDPTGVLRRTARRIARNEASGLLARAVGVSDERIIEDTLDSRARATTMRRIIVKNVEVPVKRQVKVAVRTKKIVPKTETKRVLVKRLVEVRPTWCSAPDSRHR